MIVSLYGWCGAEIPDPDITKDLQFIPFNAPKPLLQHTKAIDSIVEKGTNLLPEDVMAGLRSQFFDTKVKMCADLDWRPFRHYKPDITCLVSDPNVAEETAGFKTDICSVGMFCLTSFDLTLERRLEKYL